MKLIHLIQQAVDLRGLQVSSESKRDYLSHSRNLIAYLSHIGQSEILGTDFTRKLAHEFSDYLLIERQHSHVTRNNNIRTMGILFRVLVDREYIPVNVFAKMEKLREAEKRRKVYERTECSTIINYVRATNPPLLTAIFVCYYCALRRTEMQKVRVGDVDTKNGYIMIDGTDTKNGKVDAIIIPNEFKTYLEGLRLEQYPKHYFLFGNKITPGPKKCGQNTIAKAHRDMLRLLHEYDGLTDIEGKSFYSWKDTAVRDMIQHGISAPEIQKHLRHSSLETTQRYMKWYGGKNSTVRTFVSGFNATDEVIPQTRGQLGKLLEQIKEVLATENHEATAAPKIARLEQLLSDKKED